MKPKEYIKKYDLDNGINFNHSEFVSDFTFDFVTLIEVQNKSCISGESKKLKRYYDEYYKEENSERANGII